MLSVSSIASRFLQHHEHKMQQWKTPNQSDNVMPHTRIRPPLPLICHCLTCMHQQKRIRVFIFLLSGLFCCLGFSGVIFICCLGGGVFLFFGVWAGAQVPPKQQKKQHAPAPSERIFFCAVWAGGVFFFFFLFSFFWGGRGAGVKRVGRFFFCCLGGGRGFFCCLGGGVFFFLLFGPEACFFFFFLLFGRGTGVHSLTRLPGSSLSDPTTRETEQQKKTRVPQKRWKWDKGSGPWKFIPEMKFCGFL